MSFDEWYHCNCDDSLCYESARRAWNAAINTASLQVAYGCGWEDEEVQDRVEKEIDKLLTK